VDRNHRPRLGPGERLQGNWQSYMAPVPRSLIAYLPPVPPGYQVGYYDGYCIVYNPYTGVILNIIDLLNY